MDKLGVVFVCMVDRGTIHWEILDWAECEQKGYFSGIRIGNKNIYLVSPYEGSVKFVAVDLRGSKVKDLSQEEFFTIINTIFEEDEIHSITKEIWRASS